MSLNDGNGADGFSADQMTARRQREDEDEEAKKRAGRGGAGSNPADARLGADIRPDVVSAPGGLQTITTQKSVHYRPEDAAHADIRAQLAAAKQGAMADDRQQPKRPQAKAPDSARNYVAGKAAEAKATLAAETAEKRERGVKLVVESAPQQLAGLRPDPLAAFAADAARVTRAENDGGQKAAVGAMHQKPEAAASPADLLADVEQRHLQILTSLLPPATSIARVLSGAVSTPRLDDFQDAMQHFFPAKDGESPAYPATLGEALTEIEGRGKPKEPVLTLDAVAADAPQAVELPLSEALAEIDGTAKQQANDQNVRQQDAERKARSGEVDPSEGAASPSGYVERMADAARQHRAEEGKDEGRSPDGQSLGGERQSPKSVGLGMF